MLFAFISNILSFNFIYLAFVFRAFLFFFFRRVCKVDLYYDVICLVLIFSMLNNQFYLPKT